MCYILYAYKCIHFKLKCMNAVGILFIPKLSCESIPAKILFLVISI